MPLRQVQVNGQNRVPPPNEKRTRQLTTREEEEEQQILDRKRKREEGLRATKKQTNEGTSGSRIKRQARSNEDNDDIASLEASIQRLTVTKNQQALEIQRLQRRVKTLEVEKQLDKARIAQLEQQEEDEEDERFAKNQQIIDLQNQLKAANENLIAKEKTISEVVNKLNTTIQAKDLLYMQVCDLSMKVIELQGQKVTQTALDRKKAEALKRLKRRRASATPTTTFTAPIPIPTLQPQQQQPQQPQQQQPEPMQIVVNNNNKDKGKQKLMEGVSKEQQELAQQLLKALSSSSEAMVPSTEQLVDDILDLFPSLTRMAVMSIIEDFGYDISAILDVIFTIPDVVCS